MAKSNSLPMLLGFNNTPSKLFNNASNEFDKLNKTKLRPTEFTHRLEYGLIDKVANRDDYYNNLLQKANIDISQTIRESSSSIGAGVNTQIIEEIIQTVLTAVQNVNDLEPSQRKPYMLSKDKTINEIISLIPSVSNRKDIDEETIEAINTTKKELKNLWETTKATVFQQSSAMWKNTTMMLNGLKSLGGKIFGSILSDIPVVGGGLDLISGMISGAWQKRQQKREFAKAADLEDQRIKENLSAIKSGDFDQDFSSMFDSPFDDEPKKKKKSSATSFEFGSESGSSVGSIYDDIVRADLFTNRTWFETIDQLIKGSFKKENDESKFTARRTDDFDSTVDILDQEIPKGTPDDPIFVTMTESPIIEVDASGDDEKNTGFLHKMFGSVMDGSIFKKIPTSIAGMAAGLVPAITAIAPAMAIALGGAVAVAVAAYAGKYLHDSAKKVEKAEDDKLEVIERDRIRQEQKIMETMEEGPERDAKIERIRQMAEFQREGALAGSVDDPNSNVFNNIRLGILDFFGSRRNARKDAEKNEWLEADEKQRIQAEKFERVLEENQDIKRSLENTLTPEEMMDVTFRASMGNSKSSLRQKLNEIQNIAGGDQGKLDELVSSVVKQYFDIKDAAIKTEEAERSRTEKAFIKAATSVGNQSGQMGGGWGDFLSAQKPPIYPVNVQDKMDSAPKLNM